MSNMNIRYISLMGTTALLALSVPAIAQQAVAQAPAEAQDAISHSTVDEIVVTARRKSENLQRTPVAVTAISSAKLEQAQIRDVGDIQRLAPSLSIAQGGGSPVTSFAFVAIRGQSNLNGTTASDPAVGIYLDGVYVARPAGSLFDLVDMERVEVLRGPQGTLFGRATTGGALNFITKKPTGEFEGSVEANIGNFGLREITGIVNIPLKDDQLALRIAYKHKEFDGYGRQLSLNYSLYDTKSNYVRAELRIAPTDAIWNVELSGDYDKSHGNGPANHLIAYNSAFYNLFGLGSTLNAALMQNTGFYNTRGQQFTTTDPAFYPNTYLKNYGFSATVNVDLGKVNLKSITGYRSLRTGGWVDLDGSDADILNTLTIFSSKGFSQELQISGSAGRLSYIGGLYYFRETGNELAVAHAFGFLGLPYLRNDGDVASTSKATYGQMYYDLTDRLKLSAGLRWTWDKRSVNLHNLSSVSPPVCGVASVVPAPGCSLPESVNFNYPAYTVGIDFRANDHVFAYLKSSAAKMAGGFNLRLGSIPAFRPEGVKDVEIGVKADWLDRRLRTNLAVFHSWQTDVQRTVGGLLNNQPQSFVQNAGKAQITGVEFEGVAVPWGGMELTGSASYLHGRYDKGTYTEIQTIAGVPGCNGGQAVGTYNCVADQSSLTLPQTPVWTYNIGATQTVALGFGKLLLHADYAHIGSMAFNGGKIPAAAQPAATQALYATQTALNFSRGYGLVGAKITFQLQNPKLEFSVWGRNLAQKHYATREFSDLYSGLGIALQYNGVPRTFGVSAKASF